MDTMKRFFLYFLMLIGFMILSSLLINVGLETTYKPIEQIGSSIFGINIYQADATRVNGRIRGTISTDSENNLNGKYIKLEFYSKRNVFMGKNYINFVDLKTGDTEPFELFFKAKDVSYYKMSVVDEKEEGKEIEILPREMKRSEIILGTIVTFLIFW